MNWSPPTGQPSEADDPVQRRKRERSIQVGRVHLLEELGVNRRLIELVWGDAPAALRPHLNEVARRVEWMDWEAASGADVVPLAATHIGEHGYLATSGGFREFNAPEPPRAVDELWIWAELLGVGLTSHIEEAHTEERDISDELAAVRTALQAAECPGLVSWLDAVLWLSESKGMYWSGPEVEEAMSRFPELPPEPPAPWWRFW